jgi:hypothetical protein
MGVKIRKGIPAFRRDRTFFLAVGGRNAGFSRSLGILIAEIVIFIAAVRASELLELV